MKPAASTASALESLRAALPSDCVAADADSRFRASFDNARLSFLPDAVVRVRGAAQVSTVLELANAYGVPVTTRGGGSATTGATSPVKGGWVLDVSGLRGIAIDARNATATVGPGVTVEELDTAARAHGLFFAPDPSSKKYATAGGIVATNAGGMRGAKYGVTRDYVLRLSGFLPTGEPVGWGAPLRKFVSGLNLRDLWVGAEGTLGVVTEVTFRLLPAPAARHTFLAAFTTEDTALAAVEAILSRPLAPAILEFLDAQTVACVEARHGPVFGGHDDGPPSILLIELDGRAGLVAEDAGALRAVLQEAGAVFRDTADAGEAEQLWAVRRRCSQAMFALGDTKLNEDVVVPREAYGPLLAHTRELKARTGLATPTFGHAADGNFHVHIMFNRADKAQRAQAEIAVGELMRKVVALGGSITGEHGIGLAKSPFLRLQHTEAEIAAMRRVKDALDPRGILNPGKIFDPVNIWELEPVEVTLPWDH